MEDNLIEILSAFGYPVRRQGSLTQDAYPDTFFTFWSNDETGQSYYNNGVASIVYSYSVYTYSTDTEFAYTLQRNAVKALEQNGWTISDRGYDVQSDDIDHIGRGFDILYLDYPDTAT